MKAKRAKFAILHLLYTIQPFHDLLKQPRKTEDIESDAIANAFDELFPQMDVSRRDISSRKRISAFGWGTEQLQHPSEPFKIFITLMDQMVRISSGAGKFILYDIFWSEFRYSKTSPPAEPALYIIVDAHRRLNFEEAIKTWLADEDSPLYRCLFGRLATLLVMKFN
ncbi:MAG: hypothetical protein Q9184_007178 [Pyrenodesmia sp. 2 TL-2023]